MDLIAELFERPQYSLGAEEKERLLLAGLKELDAHHRQSCEAYARLARVMGRAAEGAECLAELPWLPVGLFKSHRLSSVPEDEIISEIRSSGTTSQAVSRVPLDRATADRQSRALIKIMGHVLGRKRRPMIVVDTESVLSDAASFSARGAGVMGMMRFGHDHLFALDNTMQLREQALGEFLARHREEKILIFGFTFVVWKYLLPGLQRMGCDLSEAVLVHSGGWKRLAAEAVGNHEFKKRLREAAGLRQVVNFYGMAEQVGSVFVEGADGFLYPPNFADVIVRDPATWQEAPVGRPGVIQVVSLLPSSYPGHSLLTEDLGVVHGIDDGADGRLGKRFEVIGRVPRAELRGCSDVIAATLEGTP